VACCFGSTNLKPVYESLKSAYPGMEFIVCGDDDQFKKVNAGRNAAEALAKQAGIPVVFPVFESLEGEPTDFNDLHQREGIGAVRRQVITAGWNEPGELIVVQQSAPYPLDVLPGEIGAAVKEVSGFVQCPVAMSAQSALAAISTACQGHYDVEREKDGGLSGPVSLYMLCIAGSGERKSHSDKQFSECFREFIDRKLMEIQPEEDKFKAALHIWNAKVSGIKAKITQLTKDGKATGDKEKELERLVASEPQPPQKPDFFMEDVTPEAVCHSLAKEWPSAAAWSAEAGAFFNSHGMRSGSLVNLLSMFNKFWSGEPYACKRRGEGGTFTVKGARLAASLLVQEETLRSFFDETKGLSRGTGFMARFLIAWPESLMGSRMYQEPPKGLPATTAFNKRILETLGQPFNVNKAGHLTPETVRFSPDGKAAWIEIHNSIEYELRQFGGLRDISDVASKAAENVARLAALFHIFSGNPPGGISADHTKRAAAVIAWHLNEARRFFEELCIDEGTQQAMKVDQWLIDHCRANGTNQISRPELQRYGPARDGNSLTDALESLEDADRVKVKKIGRKKWVVMNPFLLEQGQ
jgi:putative DNA primase/helicase